MDFIFLKNQMIAVSDYGGDFRILHYKKNKKFIKNIKLFKLKLFNLFISFEPHPTENNKLICGGA